MLYVCAYVFCCCCLRSYHVQVFVGQEESELSPFRKRGFVIRDLSTTNPNPPGVEDLPRGGANDNDGLHSIFHVLEVCSSAAEVSYSNIFHSCCVKCTNEVFRPKRYYQ